MKKDSNDLGFKQIVCVTPTEDGRDVSRATRKSFHLNTSCTDKRYIERYYFEKQFLYKKNWQYTQALSVSACRTSNDFDKMFMRVQRHYLVYEQLLHRSFVQQRRQRSPIGNNKMAHRIPQKVIWLVRMTPTRQLGQPPPRTMTWGAAACCV